MKPVVTEGYIITVRHEHKIKPAYSMIYLGSLLTAKRIATAEFEGDDNLMDHEIIIMALMDCGRPIVASRFVGDKRWVNHQ